MTFVPNPEGSKGESHEDISKEGIPTGRRPSAEMQGRIMLGKFKKKCKSSVIRSE